MFLLFICIKTAVISLAVIGEVALVNLGMNDDDYNYLCTDTDFIIHAAAAVNLVYPYSVSMHNAI